jgi:hypothetical protein
LKNCFIRTLLLALMLAPVPKSRGQEQQPYEEGSSRKIVAENTMPGTDEDRIDTRNAASAGEVEAYGSALSVWPGETLSVFARSATGEDLRGRVFRKGWYNGLRACAKTPWLDLPGKKRNGQPQPMPQPDPITGLVECQWESSLDIPIPADWVSGIYLLKLVGKNTGKQSFVPFVVRDESSSDILMQLSVTTYAAYNGWGGKSLYPHNSVGTPAVMVSLNKPFAYNGNAGNYPGAGEVSRWELPMATFLERNGYDVSYCTDIDTHQDPEMLLRHKAFLCVGHDEYWSWEMRANVTRARDSGVDLAFFSGNSCYWQIRFAADSHGKANRTIVCYKDRALTQDPYMNDGNPEHRALVTVRWRDFPVLMPEDGLLGVMYLGQYQGTSNLQFTTGIERITWLSRGIGLAAGSILGGLVGYEADSFYGVAGGPEGGHAPLGTQVLAQSQISGAPPGKFSHMTIYTAPSGALVFATGSMQWNWGLEPKLSGYWSNAAEQLSHNLLRRFIAPPSREGVTLVAARSPKKATEGEPVTVTIRARGVHTDSTSPTGVVELRDGDRLFAAGLLRDGDLEVTTTSFAVGRHTISIRYSGDDSFKPATGAVDLKVKRKPS